MKCKICQKENKSLFTAKILRRYNVKYFYCENCGFLQTEEPYWIEEAYKKPIIISDTGYLSRNITISKKLIILLYLFFGKNYNYLDYAGGYGVLVRLMRDYGYNFFWYDKYSKNVFAQGFEYKNQQIDVITTFESFEHLVNPIKEIKNMLNISENIIFSTEILPYPIPKSNSWWYYDFNHGQHISFYSNKTLNYIANKFNLYYYNFGLIKIFTRKKFFKFTNLILKLDKIGLHKFIEKKLKSKTWQDHLKLKDININ